MEKSLYFEGIKYDYGAPHNSNWNTNHYSHQRALMSEYQDEFTVVLLSNWSRSGARTCT